MTQPVTKPSKRLKKKSTNDDFKPEENPLEILKKKFFTWLNTWFGWKGGALLFAPFALWISWPWASKLPYMDVVTTQVRELRGVPRAQGDRFSILIAKLGNDENDVHRRLIDDALRGRFNNEIEVLLPNRRISIDGNEKPQEAVKVGHERAHALLLQANANVMIWGEVLDAKTDAPMRLHWTVNAEAELSKSTDKYLLEKTNYDLPELFWADLSDVLSLLATSQATAFSRQAGIYVADRLELFIKQVRLLIGSGKLAGRHQAGLLTILASSLSTYGGQRGDAIALMDAVAAYRGALREFTREQVPVEWAQIQFKLGNALSRLGEPESGTARLDEAVAAYREALKVVRREQMPLPWAAIQNNLGSTLSMLGTRESGTARLDEAVASYREALKVRTRGRVPLAWATTQNNLGITLSVLGVRQRRTALLDEAVAAYRETLKEYRRERVPLDWAAVQNNLASTLVLLAKEERGTARLGEAVAALREALKERTRERNPTVWSVTQDDLGSVLLELGMRERGTARLYEAVAAFREALKERARARDAIAWASSQFSLGSALGVVGYRESGTARLEEAAAAFREALKGFGSESTRSQQAQQILEATEQMLSERKAQSTGPTALHKGWLIRW